MNQNKVIKIIAGVSVGIIILNFIIELCLGEQIVTGNENLRLFFSFFPTVIVFGALTSGIVIDAVNKCRKYEREPEIQTAAHRISKRNFYITATCALVLFIIGFCIVSFFVTKENAVFSGGLIRTFWIIFLFAAVAAAVARSVILEKVYSNKNIKKESK